MKAELKEARLLVSEALGHSVGARLLRVMALGALLVGAAALYFSVSQGEAGNQSASITSPSGEVSASMAEDLAELPYDDLTNNFFGIAASGGQIPAYEEFDPAEWPYDELSKNFLGIPLTTKKVQQRGQVDLIRERIELIEDLEEMGVPWHMDDQGRVVFGVAPIAGKEKATLSTDHRSPPGTPPEQ